jgi:oligopeptide transport system substrate-binding protein
MVRLLSISLVLLALLAGAMAWSARSHDQRADFAFINRGDNKTLDPNNMSWMQDIRLSYALWEGLYTLDPVTVQPIHGAADRIDVTPDQRTWTFHIRPTARWTNGDPLRAQDFAFEWRRMLQTPGEYTYLHHYIAGAEAYEDAYAQFLADAAGGKKAQRPDFSTVGERVVDDHTFVVILTHPVTFFPSLCAFPPFFPMHEPSMRPFASTDPATGDTTYDAAFTRPPNLVTDGPYRMAEWSFKRRVRLIASDFYWDRAHVRSRVIDQIADEEALSAYRLYEQGDVDWLASFETDPELPAALLKRGGRPDLQIIRAFGTYYYDFNCRTTLPDGRPNPLADRRVRRALAMAVDKLPIVRDIGRLGQPISRVYVPPGVFAGYTSPPGLPYDVPQAQRLLAQAGYPAGHGFPRLSILFNNEATHGDIATVIRRQWLTNLGIDVDLEGVEIKMFGERKHKGGYSICRGGWYGDYYDPSTFTDVFLSNSDNNDNGYSNPQYDALCAAAAVETNVPKRTAELAAAENILLEDAPIMPLFGYVGAYLTRPGTVGLALDAQQTVMFNAIAVPPRAP